MPRICVNLLSVINSASNITTEIINGAEHIFVKNVGPGCSDVLPQESEWKALAAGISKGWCNHPSVVDGVHWQAAIQ
jgi:hypothetical protein